MHETVALTPAQIDFLRRTLPGFETADSMAELAGRAASQRYFVRIPHAGVAYILIVWDRRDEDWERFLSLGRDRASTGALLPQIFADDPRHGLILEEDLGAVTLKQFCAERSNDRAAVAAAYRQALDALVVWQSPTVAAHPVIAARAMDEDTFMWETGYFARFCVTDFCGREMMLGDAWEDERLQLARDCATLPRTAIHRDFQSENVMLHSGQVRFVDFQGARLGPAQYDIASLLFDPYCVFLDDALRAELYGYYCHTARIVDLDAASLHRCAAQRLMQALGAYGNLSLHKGKEWYRAYIPVALERLCGVMEHLKHFPAITEIVTCCLSGIRSGNRSSPR